MFPSTKVRQVRIQAVYPMLTVAVACLPGMAWAGDWTHDGTYGAATVVALPGGQAILARDGADQQARAITYTATDGAVTTITRDYGPSGHKAVEVENGTLRQHVYGAGLAPLLRVEGDGSLTYQVGPDTISVDAAGSATVAHLVTDIKQSTVAVLDAQGQPRQQVAYGTLGQSTSRQQSSSVYAAAAQLSNYEGLSLGLLDQLVDNRARIYFPLAGRFLALDAAGKARAYEARGNNWIMRADYDGYMDKLVDALEKDRSIVVAIGEHHELVEGIRLLMMLIDRLEAKGIPFKIYQENNLLRYDAAVAKKKKSEYNNRVEALGLTKRVQQLYKDGHLRTLAGDTIETKAANEEKALILASLANDPLMKEFNLQRHDFYFAASRNWNIPVVKNYAKEESTVTILFTGLAHLLPNMPRYHYYREMDGETYKIMFRKPFEAVLQPFDSYNMVSVHKLLALRPKTPAHNKFYKNTAGETYYPYQKVVVPWGRKKYAYSIFTTDNAVENHPALEEVFNVDNDENDKKNNDEVDYYPLLNSESKPLVKNINKEIEEEEKAPMPHGSCSGCLVQ